MTNSPSPQAVSPQVMEAIAHNLCSLHDFDVDFVMAQEKFARAVITEYRRASPADGVVVPREAVAREALEPFANLGVSSGPDDEPCHYAYRITRGAIRNARQALARLSTTDK